MSDHTPRQEEAFSRYKSAVADYWKAKTRPVFDNEQAKARWADIQRLRELRENAEDELFASIVDDMTDDDCTCATEPTAICPLHQGYAR